MQSSVIINNCCTKSKLTQRLVSYAAVRRLGNGIGMTTMTAVTKDTTPQYPVPTSRYSAVVWFDEDLPVCGCGNVLEINAQFCCCCGVSHDPTMRPKLRANGSREGKGKGEGYASGKEDGVQTTPFGGQGHKLCAVPLPASAYPGLMPLLYLFFFCCFICLCIA